MDKNREEFIDEEDQEKEIREYGPGYEDYIQSLIGDETTEKCPECGGIIYANKNGDIWCGNCGYSNDKELTEFWETLQPKA